MLDAQGLVKIGDLGCSIKLDCANYVGQKCLVGSLYWLPPECALSLEYSTKSDIWSIGCLAIEMLQGLPPFSTLNKREVLTALAKGDLPVLSPEVTVSQQCTHFLSCCLITQPSRRSSASLLINHPFLSPP